VNKPKYVSKLVLKEVLKHHLTPPRLQALSLCAHWHSTTWG